MNQFVFADEEKAMNVAQMVIRTDVQPLIDKRECAALYDLASRVPRSDSIVRVVEIGTFRAGSTCCLALGMQAGYVMTIDPYVETEDFVTSKTAWRSVYGPQKLGVGHRIIRMLDFSEKVLPGLPPMGVCLAHIDGNHEAEPVLQDLEMMWRHVDPERAIIAMHDYFVTDHSYNPGVEQAVTEFMVEHPELTIVQGAECTCYLVAPGATWHPIGGVA